MNRKKEVAVLIPSLAPSDRLIEIIGNIKKVGFERILIVNDGSDLSYDECFNKAEDLGVTVISHAVNLGKGRALKTGINYILTEWKDCVGVITADSDGQHSAEDILKCKEELLATGDKLVLGCRNFSETNIPLKSKVGNIITARVMQILVGVSVSDTQTGLRGFSRELMKRYLEVSGERFEYETNVLLFSKEEGIDIVEVDIETIYLENNKSSHFRPFIDSVKIYGLFLKFIIASLSSFIIDIGLFSLASFLFKDIFPTYYIIVSTVFARVVSSMYNFIVNKQGVFKNNDNLGGVMVKYYTLSIIQMLISALGVWSFHNIFKGSETVIKIIVDSILFLISFQIQREWVFEKKADKEK